MPRAHAIIAALLVLGLFSTCVTAAEDLVVRKSPYSVAQTIDRFAQQTRSDGLKIFDRVDHAAGAERVGLELRPTELLIFGNPKGGTPLMQCAQSAAIDLPLKALAWEDENGQVWLGYNDPAYIATRHGAPDCKVIEPMQAKLSKLAEATVDD